MSVEDKYLPIGTICTVREYSKKVIIVGYYAIQYNGNVNMYDYKGYSYPEGLLLDNKSIYFNHSDIIKIDFMGFKNDDYNKFNNILLGQNSDEQLRNKTLETKGNFKFDENGVVVYDPFNKDYYKSEIKVSDNVEKDKSIDIDNPFYKKYEEKSEKESTDAGKWPIFKNIVFDENGIVVSAEER